MMRIGEEQQILTSGRIDPERPPMDIVIGPSVKVPAHDWGAYEDSFLRSLELFPKAEELQQRADSLSRFVPFELMEGSALTAARMANVAWLAQEEGVSLEAMTLLAPSYEQRYGQELFGESINSALVFNQKTGDFLRKDALVRYQKSLRERMDDRQTALLQAMNKDGYFQPSATLSPDGMNVQDRAAKIEELEGLIERGKRSGNEMPEMIEESRELNLLRSSQTEHQERIGAWFANLVTPMNVAGVAKDEALRDEKLVDDVLGNGQFLQWIRTRYPEEWQDEGIPGQRQRRRRAGEFLATMPEAADVLWDLARRTGKGYFTNTGSGIAGGTGVIVEGLGWQQGGERLRDVAAGAQAEAATWLDPRLNETGAAGVAEGGGAIAGSLVVGLSGASGARMLGMGQKGAEVVGGLTLGMTGGTANSYAAYQDAERHGASPEEALKAGEYAFLVGTTNAIPTLWWLQRLQRSEAVRGVLAKAASEATQAALQGGGEQFANNVIAQNIYDQNRDLFQGLLEQAETEAGVALIMSTLVSTVANARAGRFANKPVSKQKSAPENGEEKRMRFSKSSAATPEEVGRAWLELAKDENTRILGPNSQAKDLQTILNDLSDNAGRIKIYEGTDGQGPGYTFEEPSGGKIILMKDTDRSYRINSAGTKDDAPQARFGTDVYQAIYTWAHNNNLQINEDHEMLPDGVYRRTSHMLSNALRFGTTRHMTVGEKSGLIDQWIRNDDSPEATRHNIGLLAMKEAEIVMKRLPQLGTIRYDAESQSFYDGESRIPDAQAQAYIRRAIGRVDPGFPRRIGAATLRRALATLQLSQKAGTEWNRRLVGPDAKASQALHDVRYSRATSDAGGGKGDERSRSDTTGGESQEVSGESAAGVRESKLPRAPRQERTAEVRRWTDSILSGWNSKLDVVIHDSAGSISDPRLRQAVADGGEGRVEAFYDPTDRRIHLLADRVGSLQDVERLVRHEGIHDVIHGPMAGQYRGILGAVRRQISDEQWRELKKAYPEANDHVLIEEYLAYTGQMNPDSTAWRSFVYEMKRVLRNVLGDKVEFTDADIQAFLHKANRKLEKGGESQGFRLYTAADLRFAKGSERKSWDEVKIGDDFNAVKKHLPRGSDASLTFDTRGTPEEVYKRIATELRRRPYAVDADGLKVLVADPQGNDPDLLIRAEHLAASKNDTYKRGEREYRLDKAQAFANVWRTIEDYSCKFVHHGDTAYVRKYSNGTVHMVFVNKGKVVDQQRYDAVVASQRNLIAAQRLEGATIAKKGRPGAFPIQGKP